MAEPRLTRSVALHSESPATVPTGIDVWLAGPTALTAPFAGLVVTAGDGEVVLAGEDGALVVRGTSLHPARLRADTPWPAAMRWAPRARAGCGFR